LVSVGIKREISLELKMESTKKLSFSILSKLFWVSFSIDTNVLGDVLSVKVK
jgi:hypothetical protein